MGLDMYFYRANKTHHTPHELEGINCDDPRPGRKSCRAFLPLHEFMPCMYSIFHELFYWRKFNALHNWFVENVQDGVDKCQLAEVTKDALDKLVCTLDEAATSRNAEIIPPTCGFFFGSIEVDDYYWDRIAEALLFFLRLQEEADWERYRYFYQSSW